MPYVAIEGPRHGGQPEAITDLKKVYGDRLFAVPDPTDPTHMPDDVLRKVFAAPLDRGQSQIQTNLFMTYAIGQSWAIEQALASGPTVVASRSALMFPAQLLGLARMPELRAVNPECVPLDLEYAKCAVDRGLDIEQLAVPDLLIIMRAASEATYNRRLAKIVVAGGLDIRENPLSDWGMSERVHGATLELAEELLPGVPVRAVDALDDQADASGGLAEPTLAEIRQIVEPFFGAPTV